MQLSIVSYLDDTATTQVRELQQTMSEITGSKASLSSWLPHITLGDGVDVMSIEVENLVEEIQSLASTTPAFTLEITGFSSLNSRPIGISEVSTPYAIFIDVIVNESLLELVDKIDEITKGYSLWYRMPRPYLPHVTIAFRDLSEAGYKNGLEYLSDKNTQLTSMIDHVSLVEKLPDIDTEYMRILLANN